MQHVMLDLETLGTKPGCVIRSIGGLFFDPHSDAVGEHFYVNVCRESCVTAGLVVDPDTEAWWKKQSQTAQDAFLVDVKPLKTAITEFTNFVRKGGDVRVWSQGANFDTVLIDACYAAVQVFVPWRFYNTRDTRTIYDMAGLDTRNIRREGTHHNALDDCRFQAKCVQQGLRMIKSKVSAC